MPGFSIKEADEDIDFGCGLKISNKENNYHKQNPPLFYSFYMSIVKILVSANDTLKQLLKLSDNDEIILFENTIYQFKYLIGVSSNNLGISHLCVEFSTCHQNGSIHFVYNYNNDNTTLNYGNEGWNNKYKFIISQFHLINFEDNQLKSKIVDIFTDYGLLNVRPRSDDYDTNTTKKICS